LKPAAAFARHETCISPSSHCPPAVPAIPRGYQSTQSIDCSSRELTSRSKASTLGPSKAFDQAPQSKTNPYRYLNSRYHVCVRAMRHWHRTLLARCDPSRSLLSRFLLELARTIAPPRSPPLPTIQHAPTSIDVLYRVLPLQPLPLSKGRYLATRRVSAVAVVPCDCRRTWSSKIVRHPWRHWPGLYGDTNWRTMCIHNICDVSGIHIIALAIVAHT
jgi:hypothetical protein